MEYELEPLPAGSRFRPPTLPPAPPGCGDGSQPGGGGWHASVSEGSLLGELQFEMDAALCIAQALRSGPEEPTAAEVHRIVLNSAVRSLRSRLRWAQVQSLLGFGMYGRVLREFKLQLLEIAVQPACIRELELRWMDVHQRLLAGPLRSHNGGVWLEAPHSFRHARFALSCRWLPAPFFLRAMFRKLAQELDRPENLATSTAFHQAIVQPLFVQVLAAIAADRAPRPLRIPRSRPSSGQAGAGG